MSDPAGAVLIDLYSLVSTESITITKEERIDTVQLLVESGGTNVADKWVYLLTPLHQKSVIINTFLQLLKLMIGAIDRNVRTLGRDDDDRSADTYTTV